MLPATSRALPRPLLSRSRTSMSMRMSATIFCSRDWLENTFCIVPQRALSCALASGVSARVAEVVVFELVHEQPHDSALGLALDFTDRSHGLLFAASRARPWEVSRY